MRRKTPPSLPKFFSARFAVLKISFRTRGLRRRQKCRRPTRKEMRASKKSLATMKKSPPPVNRTLARRPKTSTQNQPKKPAKVTPIRFAKTPNHDQPKLRTTKERTRPAYRLQEPNFHFRPKTKHKPRTSPSDRPVPNETPPSRLFGSHKPRLHTKQCKSAVSATTTAKERRTPTMEHRRSP